MHTDLLTLIENVDFEELSHEDKTWVLTQVSEGEYKRLRASVLLSQTHLLEKESQLMPLLPSQIWNQIDSTPVSKPWTKKVENLFTYRIPVWKAIAASIVLIASLTAWGNLNTNTSSPRSAYDSSAGDTLVGLSLEEDSIFRKFMIESL